MSTTSLRLGIIGAGKLGMTVARLAVAAGVEVTVSNSGNVEDLAFTAQFLAPGVEAGTPAEAVAHTDLVLLAVPFHRFRTLPADMLSGRIVIDAMNYWESVDGTLPNADVSTERSSLLVQQWFQGSKVVRTLNQLGYHDLNELPRAAGASDRTGAGVRGRDHSRERRRPGRQGGAGRSSHQ
ncbi:NAD(P)-binding domain-containing protein [Phycicoccus sp. CSK15P-2]|uniref:NADPH-dependent F420 reductase n=1 Tax=Phycicoccus sp. CSK15P-2 TaxID=2807627 RepID=UPI00194F60E9|nr:NAD(P)-binding domain-containing protein [Phycicoccus sp. CSK15P-2]MBM6402660.1 NAD(P)-binding domain-containing protein [Phycicoccus sp. CSK15P-2]